MEEQEEQLLIAADEETALEEKHPPLRDAADEELYEEHHKTRKDRRSTVRCLTVALLGMTWFAIHEANKPAINHFGRAIDGKFTWGSYDDTTYVAQPIDAVRALQDWATYLYRRLRTAPKGSDPIAEFNKSHLFYAADVAKTIMEEEAHLGVIANVLNGTAPEQDVEKPVVILEAFGRQSYGGHRYWGGRAIVNLQINIAPLGNTPAHREHLVVPVDFYLNPDQVPLKSADDPSYQEINGNGLVIIRPPIENILNDAAMASAQKPAAAASPKGNKTK